MPVSQASKTSRPWQPEKKLHPICESLATFCKNAATRTKKSAHERHPVHARGTRQETSQLLGLVSESAVRTKRPVVPAVFIGLSFNGRAHHHR